jgi:hypothetical protein
VKIWEETQHYTRIEDEDDWSRRKGVTRRASNRANLMLDESPLIVRIFGLAGFMVSSLIVLQSE